MFGVEENAFTLHIVADDMQRIFAKETMKFETLVRPIHFQTPNHTVKKIERLICSTEKELMHFSNGPGDLRNAFL